jgi:hypothetical protein
MPAVIRASLAESNQSGVPAHALSAPHHSIDRWDDATGSNLYEHLAGVNDLLLARATFEARREALARRQDHPAQRRAHYRENLAGG